MSKSIVNNLHLSIIFLFAILPFFGFFTYSILGKPPETFLIMLSLVASIGILLEKGNIKMPIYVIFFACFFIYTLLSDIFIVGESISFSYLRNNTLLGSLLILLIIEEVEIPENFHGWIIKASYWIIVFASFVIIIQQFFSRTFLVRSDLHFLLNSSSSVESRLPSIYSWAGTLGLGSIGFSYFPILGYFVERELIAIRERRYVVLYIFGIIVAIFNKSRFVLLNFLLLFTLLPIHKGFTLKDATRYLLILLSVVILVYTGSKAVGFEIDNLINERILEKDRGGVLEGSAGTRILAFKVFGQLFPKNPVFGKGKFHQFGEGENASRDLELMRTLHGRSSQIHVGYLSLFYYYGIIGGSLYILFLISLTIKLVKDSKITGYYSPLIAWVMFMVSNLTLVIFNILEMGIIMILILNKALLYQKSVCNELQ